MRAEPTEPVGFGIELVGADDAVSEAQRGALTPRVIDRVPSDDQAVDRAVGGRHTDLLDGAGAVELVLARRAVGQPLDRDTP